MKTWAVDCCRASWKRRLDEERDLVEGVKKGKKRTGLAKSMAR
jgi:hypothetical protein